MDFIQNDFDDSHYARYDDYRPGTPETAYKTIAGYRCTLKRGLEYDRLYLLYRLLCMLNENSLPGSGLPYTCFSVSYLHAILHGVLSDREKFCVARLEKWEEYLSHIREVTGLALRMGTKEEALVYAHKCLDVYEIHPIEWGKLFASDGEDYVLLDVYSEQYVKTLPSDHAFADILLVCDTERG